MKIGLFVRSWLLFAGLAGTSVAADVSIPQAQEFLKAQGIYKGEVNGINDPETWKAIGAYQRAHGLAETEKLDAETTAKMAASMQGAPPAPAPTKKEAADRDPASMKEAANEGKSAATSEGEKTASTAKDAGKEAGSSLKSETKAAMDEIKSIFGKDKKKPDPPPAK